MSTQRDRTQRRDGRDEVRQAQIVAQRKREIETYRRKIDDRLNEFEKNKLMAKFIEKYKRKLEEHGLNPDADIHRINNVDNLSARVKLLPPPPVYQHHRSGNHPSAKEHRAVTARTFAGHTRNYMQKHCPNDQRVMSLVDFFPAGEDSGTHIKRYAPKNIVQFRTADGTPHCVSKKLLQFFVKNGQTAAVSYQNDSYGDHWPEITNVGNKEPLIRVPFHVLNDATGNQFRVPDSSNRRQPPHMNEY